MLHLLMRVRSNMRYSAVVKPAEADSAIYIVVANWVTFAN